ncbi:MAG: FlgD immunoglobulin-like domain containing protein [Candidatus Cloacimonadales bacterium]
MKRVLTSLSILFIISMLSAEVSWGNGVPLYEGNFIYKQHSTSTPNENIYITWVQKEQGNRLLKLDKTDAAGISIWDQPITIDASSAFVIEKNILAYGEDGCLIIAYHDELDGQRVYAIDSNGNTLWQQDITNSYHNNSTISNGTALITSIQKNENDEYYVNGNMIDGNGQFLWENLNLYTLGFTYNAAHILEMRFIDDFIYLVISHNDQAQLRKYNLAGELVLESAIYPISYHPSCNFQDDIFYLFSRNGENDDLEMYKLDLAGNSLTEETPKIICTSYNWRANDFIVNEDYMYVIVSNPAEEAVFHKCDLAGNILATFTYDIGNSFYNIEVYDREIDFFSNYDYTTHEAYIVEIKPHGLGEAIDYVPEETGNYWADIFYLDESFTFVGYDNYELKQIFTMRYLDGNTTVENIQEIDYQIIEPTLVMNGSNLMALWPGDGLKYQEFDESGNPLHATNGTYFIEELDYYKIIDDKVIAIERLYPNYDYQVKIFDLDRQELMNQTFSFAYENVAQVGIYKFYDAYIFITLARINDYSDTVLEYIAFDENGMLWEEPISHDSEDLQVSNFSFKGNTLFYKDYMSVDCLKINPDGSLGESTNLSSSFDYLELSGSEDNFFAITCNAVTPSNDLYLFQNGEMIWSEAWNIDIGEFGPVNPIFEEDGFYQIGNHYNENITVVKYDYDHELIPGTSFAYDPVYDRGKSLKTFKDGEDFVFFIHSYIVNYEDQYSYIIANESGEIISEEFQETIIDRENLEYVNEVIKADDCLYIAFPCGFKPLEGEYERNFYVQKIDLQNVLAAEIDDMEKPETILSCYPNPFNPETTISFSVANEQTNTTLNIYNLKGQKIKTLLHEKLPIGAHNIVWNGLDSNNKKVASGVYLYKLTNGSSQKSAKMLLLK